MKLLQGYSKNTSVLVSMESIFQLVEREIRVIVLEDVCCFKWSSVPSMGFELMTPNQESHALWTEAPDRCPRKMGLYIFIIILLAEIEDLIKHLMKCGKSVALQFIFMKYNYMKPLWAVSPPRKHL